MRLRIILVSVLLSSQPPLPRVIFSHLELCTQTRLYWTMNTPALSSQARHLPQSAYHLSIPSTSSMTLSSFIARSNFFYALLHANANLDSSPFLPPLLPPSHPQYNLVVAFWIQAKQRYSREYSRCIATSDWTMFEPVFCANYEALEKMVREEMREKVDPRPYGARVRMGEEHSIRREIVARPAPTPQRQVQQHEPQRERMRRESIATVGLSVASRKRKANHVEEEFSSARFGSHGPTPPPSYPTPISSDPRPRKMKKDDRGHRLPALSDNVCLSFILLASDRY